MNEVLAWVAGCGLLALALVDATTTVIGVGAGRGPVTRHVSRSMWWIARRVHDRRPAHHALSFVGPVILIAIIATWGIMATAGWALIFGSEGALESVSGDDPVPGIGRIYYASTVMLGRGSAIYRPVGNLYQTLEQICGGMGIALFTLGLAYIIPVVNAVVQKRRVASYVSALGHSPRQILERAWYDEHFGALRLHLIALTPMVNELAEQHLAYPILFYFHSRERHTAIAPSLAVLDETLTMLECCAPPARLEPTSTVPVRAAVSEFLDTLYKAFVTASPDPLPRPDLSTFRDAGIPLIEDVEVDSTYDHLEGRRRLLNAMLEHDGWHWREIERGAWTDGWAMELRDRT